MQWVVAIVVALITGSFGFAGSLAMGRSSAEKVVHQVLHQLELNQAVTDEKINNYQHVTNENIKDLRDQVQSQNARQNEWGTRIALLEADVKYLKGERS